MEIEKKGNYGVTHYFKANQGNRTAVTGKDHTGRRKIAIYANEILKGDLVKITGDREVSKCAAGDTPIGIAMDDFEYEGAIPTTSAAWGEYENNCWVKVETFAEVIESVPLEPSNSKIVAGDPIKIGSTTPGCYDKGNNSNVNIAMESADANSGATIQVLFKCIPI